MGLPALFGLLVAGSAVLSSAVAADRGGALPSAGVAVQTRSGVVLVDLGGHVRRSLPGFSFRSPGVERPGQVELRDRAGNAYELRAGSLVRVAAGSITLAGGYALHFRSHWTLLRSGTVVQSFPRFAHVELDGSGSALSSLRVGTDGYARAHTVMRDLSTGKTRTLPLGCRVGARSGVFEFQLCGYPFVKRQVSTIVVASAGSRRTIAGPAERAPHGPAGWWMSVSLAPDRRSLLAQWSGECEVPTAYRVDTVSGRLTVLGRNGGGRPVESRTLGWNGAEALVSLPHSVCTGSAEQPGIYAFDAGGEARLVYRLPQTRIASAQLWK